MADRTTKVLLALIAVALYGALLRPLLLAAAPAQAQQPGPPRQAPPPPAAAPPKSCPAVFADQWNVFIAADGYLTVFTRNNAGGFSGRPFSYRYPVERTER